MQMYNDKRRRVCDRDTYVRRSTYFEFFTPPNIPVLLYTAALLPALFYTRHCTELVKARHQVNIKSKKVYPGGFAPPADLKSSLFTYAVTCLSN